MPLSYKPSKITPLDETFVGIQTRVFNTNSIFQYSRKPNKARPKVSSFDRYKYDCLKFWLLVVTVAIVITILWANCFFGGSGCCPRPEWVGDGKCNRILMNQTLCNYDNKDCCQMEKAGNRVCDEFNNNPLCSKYDGGDCQPQNIEDWPDCPHNPKFIGDGTCDDHLKNNAECNHDGGDCCDQNLIGDRFCHDLNNFESCQLYDGDDCHPTADITDWPECPHNPKFIGDGTCDYHLSQKAECNYDGSDCSK